MAANYDNRLQRLESMTTDGGCRSCRVGYLKHDGGGECLSVELDSQTFMRAEGETEQELQGRASADTEMRFGPANHLIWVSYRRDRDSGCE